ISDDFPLFQHLGSIGITTFDILHYLHTPREISHTDEIIVELADDDPFRASLPPAVEHIFAVRNAAEIITYAYSLPQISCGSSTIYAVGAMTHAAYRRRGLGKGVVAALVKQLSAEKNLALWNCDARNEASLRLARATGFIRHIWHLAWRTI
ncbi:MAG TPA: GNAT family N-acetyltransferase, partial [Armatimonadota bacterium]|nr:GNAT family N-acetyltransferase [Armatimonadota bacterium]